MRRADLRLPPGRSAMSRVALTALALGALTALPVGCQREPAPSATSGSAGRTGAPGAATAGVDAPVTHEPPPASDTPPGSSPPAGEVARRPDPSAPGAPPADATSGEPAHADAATRDGTATAGISWHHDDYEAARAIAKAEGKPLVLDLWAPWCHTCLSMKHTVLRAPGLAPYADRFVWLAIDTDRPANDAVMKAFPIVFWPTFFVVDPEDGSVQARLQGGAPEETFRAFLDQGRAAVADKRRDSGRLDEDTPLYHLRDAEQLVTAGKLEEADQAYARALSRGGDRWARRSDVLVARITTLYKREAWSECVAFAIAHLADAARSKGAAGADFASFGDTCGKKAGTPDAELAGFRATAVATIRGVLADPEAGLSVDDRADAMRIARELLDALGQPEAARRMATEQRDLLDAAAAAASTPYEAMTYSWPRCEVYAYLGEHEALVPALEALVAALPEEYDPPYRLAWLLHEAGRSADALPWAKMARERVYGPRTKRVDSLIALIQAAVRARPGKRPPHKSK